jgi:hypothetical protein
MKLYLINLGFLKISLDYEMLSLPSKIGRRFEILFFYLFSVFNEFLLNAVSTNCLQSFLFLYLFLNLMRGNSDLSARFILWLCRMLQRGDVNRFFFLIRIVGGWSPNWVHSARRPLNGLLYQPRVIMMTENLVEWRLAGETEVLAGNLSQRHFVHHKSHLTRPGFEPGPPRWEASD